MNEELKVIISAEIGQLKKELQQGQKEVEKVGTAAKDADSKFSKAMSSIGKAAAAGMKLVASAVVAGATALIGLAEATSEYRTAQAKLTSAFEAAGGTAEQAKDTYNDLYRVLGDGDVAVEAANHLAKLTTNEQELSQWTEICQGVFATFGDSIPIEGLTEAINHTVKLGEVQGPLADALEWSGISADSFNEQLAACTTESERAALIQETLNGLYGEAADNYEKNAASILRANEAQARMTDALAKLGAIAEPIVTEFKIMGATLLESLVPGLELVTEGLNAVAEGAEDGGEKISEGLASMVDGVLTTITNLLPTVLEVGVQIVVALIEGILAALPSIVETVMGLIPTVVSALLSMLPLLLEVGVQLIVSIINGLAQMLPSLLTEVVNIIPQIVNTLLTGLPAILQAAITLLLAIVAAIPEIIPNLVEALPDIVDTAVGVLIDSLPLIIDASLQLFMGVVQAIPQMIPTLVSTMPTIITNIITGLIQAIPQILAAALQVFITIPTAIIQTIPQIVNALGQIISNVKTNLIEKLKSIMKFDWSLPKLKLPRISISGKFSLSPLQVPTFSITWNKLGGVFDAPTIFGYGNSLQGLGEDGAEAIVPLEKNTGWMNVLASKLNELMQGGSARPIVLQVDGKTFAQTSLDSINQLTRQTGSLGLVIP